MQVKKKDERFVFEFEISSIGLPEMANVFKLMDLLIKHCYNVQSPTDFYSKVYNSNDPLLLHFSEVFKQGFNERIIEVVRLMQRPELNPSITFDDLVYGVTKSRLLLFNQNAYDKIFKDFIP